MSPEEIAAQNKDMGADSKNAGFQVVGTTDGNNIGLHDKYYAPDLSAPTASNYARGRFLHEMTHVWQEQHSLFGRFGIETQERYLLWKNHGTLKSYDLDAAQLSGDFNSLSIEQQATVVDKFYIAETEPIKLLGALGGKSPPNPYKPILQRAGLPLAPFPRNDVADTHKDLPASPFPTEAHAHPYQQLKKYPASRPEEIDVRYPAQTAEPQISAVASTKVKRHHDAHKTTQPSRLGLSQ